MSKYVFFTGGVVSGLGKGISAMSLGKLMKARGYSVDVIKFNPYFNVDASNLSCESYGETFITDDGRACDLVIGHYERILDESITSRNDVTSGEIYSLIIEKEKENFYDGVTVQVVPHITDEIKRCILQVGEDADVVLVEIGGTVGDIETQPYMEAIRQLKANLGKTNVAYIHVSLVPYIDVSGEQKTKPTQHSVKELQNLGIQPDIIICRSDYPLGVSSRSKLALFCNVDKDCIIESIVSPNIYEIPLMLEKDGLCSVTLRKLKMEERNPNLSDIESFCENLKRLEERETAIKIGIIGKKSEKIDINMSLRHALLISSESLDKKIEIVPVCTDFDSAHDLAAFNNQLAVLDGMIIPASLIDTSAKAQKIAIEFAKKRDIPLLLLGDSAVLGLCSDSGAAKAEKVFKEKKIYGLCPIKFEKNSLFYSAYGEKTEQRFKNKLGASRNVVDLSGMTVSGVTKEDNVCAYQMPGHRFFAGAFFRPEFLARLGKPSPIISAFLQSCEK